VLSLFPLSPWSTTTGLGCAAEGRHRQSVPSTAATDEPACALGAAPAPPTVVADRTKASSAASAARNSVERTVAYIEESFDRDPFEYVAFYAPTFTLNRRWVRELCAALRAKGSPYPWKCATTISHLPLDLLEDMAAAGCVRVSVGLETLEPDAQGNLPPQKHIGVERFQELAGACTRLGVELNCFVIAGLPGTTPLGVERTVAEIRSIGGRTRPTMYANIDRLRTATTLEDAALYNRHLLHPVDSDEHEPDLHELVFGEERHVTEVMRVIPQRA
jgi:anaerobic magnesium-protoporphyrin IX monomethyl ester cyclase